MQLAPIYPLIPLYFHANVHPGIKFPCGRMGENRDDSDVAIVSCFPLVLPLTQPSWLSPLQSRLLPESDDSLSKLNCKPTSPLSPTLQAAG